MTERIKTAASILGITIVLLVAVDLLGRAASAIDRRFFDPPTLDGASAAIDDRQFAAAYDGADYDPATLFREFAATERIVYEPYTIWDRRFYRGELINIDIQGFRATANNSDAPDALSVWVFGGSTVWGEAAPDHETIPSFLSQYLNDWGVDSTVENLGERGFVSTQEVVFLYRELQAGGRPDIVLFYDGINDAAAASNWPEIPGSHLSLHRIRDRFEFGEIPSERRRDLIRSLGIYQAARIVLDRLEARNRAAPERRPQGDVQLQPRFLDANFDYLANQALDVWMSNRETVAALADEFRFVPIFVLQPSLWTEGKPLHVSEIGILSEHLESRAMTHIMAVRAEMSSVLQSRRSAGTLPPNVHDFSGIFAAIDAPLYIDYVHTAGPGNRIAARALFDVLTADLCRAAPPNAAPRIAAEISDACS